MFFESFILAIPKFKKKQKKKKKKRTNEIRNYRQVIQCRRLDWCIFSWYISCLFYDRPQEFHTDTLLFALMRYKGSLRFFKPDHLP